MYDAIQVFENVKVNFVQKVQIRGRDADQSISQRDLSGKEIASLLQFSAFNGVITAIGADYVEASVQGATTLGRMIKQKSEVREVDPQCD